MNQETFRKAKQIEKAREVMENYRTRLGRIELPLNSDLSNDKVTQFFKAYQDTIDVFFNGYAEKLDKEFEDLKDE